MIYNDKEVLQILKKVLDEYGYGLSKHKYEKIAVGKYPSTRLIQDRFGSWNRAKHKACGNIEFNSDGAVSVLQQKLLDCISQGKSVVEIADLLDRGPNTIISEINNLENKGYSIDTVDIGTVQKLRLAKEPTPIKKAIVEQFSGNKVKIGVIADTHICSTEERLDLVKAIYEVFAEEGIAKVYHAGDLLDGENVYKGQNYELKLVGADNQIDYCINSYPVVKGITTYFITGNHDLSYFKRSGFDVGIRLAKERSDLVYLGPEEADINIQTEVGADRPVILRLFHPGGTGSAYALSYRAQRTIETYSSGEKPHILVIGHLHKASYFFVRNVHTLQAGTLQNQTRFMRNKAIEAHRGGFIVEFTVANDGSINRLKCEFLNTFK